MYGLAIPPFIREFIGNLNVKCDYFYAIATYGFFSGAVCNELNNTVTANGRHFDYINKLKMGENCVTFSDMAKTEGDSDKQQSAIQMVLDDLSSKKVFVRHESFFHKFMTKNHLKNYEFPTGVGITDKIRLGEGCTGCGTCKKVCPMKNIEIKDRKPAFGKNCVSCGGCIQNCPAKALHHKDEKSSARYTNPNIKTEELFY